IVYLYDRLTPRQIGRYSFVLVALGLTLVAVVIRNDWSTLIVILGLIVVGLGEGALATLLFNVLVTAAPKELAGDVGCLRGATGSLASAVGTAVAGALIIGVLSLSVSRNLVDNPIIPNELKAQIDLDNVPFVSNDRLQTLLEGTTATPDQVVEAVRIHTVSRLQAFKISFLVLACLALLAIFPAGGLSGYFPPRRP